MNKITAVIDKSLFQAICSEPEPQRGTLWNHLFSRYQIVIPFVLVEEVWTNLGNPGLKKPAVVQEMVSALTQMTSCWIDDEVEIVFKELVQQKQIKTLPPAPKKFIRLALHLNPNARAFFQWLATNRQLKEQAIRDRVKSQNSISPSGKFVIIGTEADLFTRYVRDQLMQILDSPARKNMLLEKLLGQQFRKRHPNCKSRIEKAFARYTKANFTRHPITLNYIMTSMFYFYAPLCRIQANSRVPPKKIIGSKRAEQQNNLQDQKYVVAALICDRLLTCDEGMRNLMKIFQDSVLWSGEAIYIDPRIALSTQIPRLLR